MSTTPTAVCRSKNPETCRVHGKGKAFSKPSGSSAAGKTRKKSSRATGKGSGANQRHGFDNELRIVTQHDLLHLKDSYTHPWDAYTKGDDPVPVSIKTKSARGSVEMGDFFRNASKTEDFFLSVSFWQNKTDNIVSEHILYLPIGYWSKQFPQYLNLQIKDLLDNITNDYADDLRWKAGCTRIHDEWAKTGSLIRLAPKRDHKTQKRMQCVIPYNNFMIMAKHYEVADFTYRPGVKPDMNRNRKTRER